MAASTQISVEEYLKTAYRPDREYIDGMVLERNLGELDHSWIQANLVSLFRIRFRESGLAAIPELRVQVKASRYRVPDVIVTRGKPNEQILRSAPLLCIEILSPEDTLSRMNERVKDYLDFGVPVVWVVDPAEKSVWVYRANGMEQATGATIKIDGTDVEIPLAEIFA